MKRVLYHQVRGFRGGANFAMPGHKGRVDFDFDLKDDMTEILGADNLLDPEGCIWELEREMTKVYGTAETALIPAGSTAAIKIALYLATAPGESVLAQRNSHSALFHGAVALDLNLRYLPTSMDAKTRLFSGIRAEDIKEALLKDSSIRTVFLTSPDYFGGILKLKEIADIVHESGATLIVDEAHGAHLPFTSLSSYSAVNVADFVVHSLHKTTPALTSAALLHTKIPYGRQLRRAMGLFLSTSPSYLSMLSSEYAVSSMERAYNEARVQDWRKRMTLALTDIIVVDERGDGFYPQDPLKFLFHVPGYRGDEVVEALAKEKVYLEMGDDYYALAILSPYNTDEDYKALIAAIDALEPREEIEPFSVPKYPLREETIKPREAFFAQRDYIPLKEAVGRVAAENITPYPPGIPMVSVGEVISQEAILALGQCKKTIGIYNGKVAVTKEASCDII